MEPGASTPRHVGPYRIESRLGAGGMGVVYRAYDERLKRPLAVKQILADKAEDATARERFRREAQAAASLSHPSIVQIYDIVEAEDGDWIVMELIEGTPLRRLLEDGPVEIGLSLRLAREIVGGLAEAHARGIVHRDLKTENVMVTASGHAKILDFGLAKRMRPDLQDPTLSVQGLVLGTVRAMSPEQAMGLPIDPRSDLFSLGSLLYETVTGESPFYRENTAMTLTRVCTVQQTPARLIHPGVPFGLSDLIDRLLEKDPDHRPQTADEVETALDRLRLEIGNATSAEQVVPRFPDSATRMSGSTVGSGLLRSRSTVSGADSEMVVKTLLMSDIVASTELVARLGDEGASQLFQRHDRLARDLLAEHGGIEIDKADGFLMLFDRPLAAVRYAVAYHEALDLLAREEGADLRSRVGIHVGEVMLHRNPHRDIARGAKQLEVEGLAKPMVARLMALAVGGQTLISRGVYDMARRGSVGVGILEQLSWLDHGSYEFKGVDEPIEVFEVGKEELSPLVAPPGTSKARRAFADIPPTEAFPAHRLSGRWPLLVGLVVLILFVGVSAWWLTTSTGTKTRPSVSVLGFKNSSASSDVAWLSTAFSEMLRTELAAGGQLRIVSGESVARMKLELALPDTDTLATDTLEKIRRNLGTDYVVVGSYLSVDTENARTVRLDFRLQDAAAGDTVTASSENGTEADLFAIVARAGAHLRSEMGLKALELKDAEAARASVSTSREATALYAKALTELRAYNALAARDLLQEAVEVDPGYALAHAALSEALLKLGYDREAEESGKRAFELAEKELPREEVLSIQGRYHEAAGHWQEAVDTYKLLWEFHSDNIEYGLRLAEVERRAGRDRDALATVAQLRLLPEPASQDIRIDLTEAAAAFGLGDYRTAHEVATRAARKARQGNARVLLAQALRIGSDTQAVLGGLAEAAAAFEESRQLFLEFGDLASAAQVVDSRALLLFRRGDLSGASQAYQEALSLHRNIGARKGASTALNNLAGVSRLRGELTEALRLLRESLKIARDLGDLRRVPTRLNHLGMVYLLRGDLAKAEEMALAAREAQETYGSRPGIAWDAHLSGEIAFARGDLNAARTHYDDALEIAQEIGAQNLEGRALFALGKLSLARGDLPEAEAHFEAAEAIQSERQERGRQAETGLARAQVSLEQKRLAEAETLARAAMVEFAREDRADDEISAAVVLTQIMRTQGRLDVAREISTTAEARSQNSENPAVRLAATVAAARVATAAGSHDLASRNLESALAEAAELGLGGFELEIRLAIGESEIASKATKSGITTLEAVARDAELRGFDLIAGKAKMLKALAP